MLDIADTVQHGVAHVEVAAGEINLRAQGVLSFRKLAVLHAFEQLQVLLHRPVAPGADGRMGGIPAVLAELFRAQLAHIGKALADQLEGKLIGLLKIIRTVEKAVAPVKAQPVDILHDGLDVFRILLGRVCIVHAQVADPAEMLGRAEIDGQRLAVSDMQIAVRLGRKAGVYLHALELPAGRKVLNDKILNKVSAGLFHVTYPPG